MRMWIGGITLAAGLLLLLSTRREQSTLPDWFARLPYGVIVLGIATLLLGIPGTAWSIASAAFSLVAIGILGSIVWRILRRR